MSLSRKFRRKLPVLSNGCGECTACCTILAVDTVNKTSYKDCQHQGNGCSIYKARPEVCKTFQCAWLQVGGPPEERPDKSGLMLDWTDPKGKLGRIPVAWEVWDGAAREGFGKAVIDKLLEVTPVIVAGREGKRYILGYEG